MDLGVHELNYMAQSHWHHFRYRLGEYRTHNGARCRYAVIDEDGNRSPRSVRSSLRTLVIAVGSLTTISVPRVKEYAIALETPTTQRAFHRRRSTP